MKKWISENWDEAMVYLLALFGAFCQMVYVARIAGARFELDWLYIVLGIVTSAVATWLAENYGIKFAKKVGVPIEIPKNGRRGNLVVRLLLGFCFGFVGMAALPNILQWMQNGAPAFMNGVLAGAP
jgi:hypothetical protein